MLWYFTIKIKYIHTHHKVYKIMKSETYLENYCALVTQTFKLCELFNSQLLTQKNIFIYFKDCQILKSSSLFWFYIIPSNFTYTKHLLSLSSGQSFVYHLQSYLGNSSKKITFFLAITLFEEESLLKQKISMTKLTFLCKGQCFYTYFLPKAISNSILCLRILKSVKADLQ